MSHKSRGRSRHNRRISTGIIRVTRKGAGFVETPEGEYFIPRSRMRGAMDGDRVEVERLSARGLH
ncbi:MAG: hypothetical protein LBC23_02815, partial [Coriobacteriales bacterium]|nr:hypothetical protein [Coriobacteriales bacterium]